MYIDTMLCTGCGECIPYCPVEAIREANGAVEIDFDGCVECGTCRRYAPCPVEAIQESPEAMEWPRVLRREYSDPGVPHSTTKGYGRGTEESKTNDVTGRVKRGRVGMGMAREVGLQPHTINLSLGIRGKKELPPGPEVLELTTMCGHALVARNLVRKAVAEVRAGRMAPEEAPPDGRQAVHLWHREPDAGRGDVAGERLT